MQIQYINNLRAVACFLVILTHSAMPAIDPKFGLFMVLFSLISSPSSELFVMISSCLLAPTKLDMKAFYKKRFAKLLPPFFFWSIVTLIIKYLLNHIDGQEIINRILLLPLVPASGIYWFVYTICGLYLIIPILSPWLKDCKKSELQTVIVIWLVTILLPYINLIFNRDIYHINGDYYFILVYYGGFIGYLFLGIYLRKYPMIFESKIKFIAFMIMLLSLGTLPVILAYAFDRNLLNLVRDNLSLTSAIYVIAIYTFFQNVKLYSKIEYFFNIIAKYSFGIYLIHFLVVRDLVWVVMEKFRFPHPLLETPFIAIISLLICLLIVKLIALLPKSNYIVGV